MYPSYRAGGWSWQPDSYATAPQGHFSPDSNAIMSIISLESPTPIRAWMPFLIPNGHTAGDPNPGTISFKPSLRLPVEKEDLVAFVRKVKVVQQEGECLCARADRLLNNTK